MNETKADWKRESPYLAAVAAGLEIDHHESDLYVKASPAAWAIVKRTAASYSTFTHQASGEQWIEIPFAYLPWWEAKPR